MDRLSGLAPAAPVAGLGPEALAFYPVAWAGEARSANWLDIGRAYTERGHHQQQIRAAVGAAGLTAPRWLRPVLEVSLRALPHAHRDATAAEGAAVTVLIDGDAGGACTIEREPERWRLLAGAAADPQARVRLSEDTAWRLFFGVPMADPRRRLAIARATRRWARSR